MPIDRITDRPDLPPAAEAHASPPHATGVAPPLSVHAAPDIPLRARPSVADVNAMRNFFKAAADAKDRQVAKLSWYEKIPGFSAVPELRRQQALHTEAAENVKSLQEATLADALLKLPAKNQPSSIKTALEMTRAGEELLPEVATGTRGLKDATKERVAQLQWALYNKAIQQLEATAKKTGQSRESLIGGMTVLDDGGRVAQFMKGVGAHYDRPSSHFQGTRVGSHGMDFNDPNIPLPAKKRTLLFGTVDGSSTYIKGEYSGYATLGDRVSHIGDFIRTNILGIREPGRREKFIPQSVKDKYGELLGPAFKSKFEKAEFKDRGIAFMLSQLPEQEKTAFVAYLEGQGLNNADIRKGEEIIVPAKALGISDSEAAKNKSVREKTRAIVPPLGFEAHVNEAISHAFGSGAKASPEFIQAFWALSNASPAAARKALDTMDNPTYDNVTDFFGSWYANVDSTNLGQAQKSQLARLAGLFYDSYLQTNAQFMIDHSAHNFPVEDGPRVFVRETAARDSFQTFYTQLAANDPRKVAVNALTREASKRGFKLELGANPSAIDPYLGIARGQDITVGRDGFQSLIAMQQGNRSSYRIDRLNLPGADKLSRSEQQRIMYLLREMEGPQKSDAGRVEAFNEAFEQRKLDGSTYLTDSKKDDLRERLLSFAKARDNSMAGIFRDVTGHDEYGRNNK